MIACQYFAGPGLAPTLAAGSGEILAVHFLVDPALPHGSILQFDFHQEDRALIDSSVVPPDTLMRFCFGSEVACGSSLPAEIYPRLYGGFMMADTGLTCCHGTMVGNIDGSPDGAVTVGDLTVLIDHLFISLAPLRCRAEANADGSSDNAITTADLTALIDHLFIDFAPLPSCPF